MVQKKRKILLELSDSSDQKARDIQSWLGAPSLSEAFRQALIIARDTLSKIREGGTRADEERAKLFVLLLRAHAYSRREERAEDQMLS